MVVYYLWLSSFLNFTLVNSACFIVLLSNWSYYIILVDWFISILLSVWSLFSKLLNFTCPGWDSLTDNSNCYCNWRISLKDIIVKIKVQVSKSNGKVLSNSRAHNSPYYNNIYYPSPWSNQSHPSHQISLSLQGYLLGPSISPSHHTAPTPCNIMASAAGSGRPICNFKSLLF